jgi:DNA modification methylase
MPVLDWIGKEAIINHHKEVPFHLLRCNDELSEGDPGSGNLLIEGDNLAALKALLPYYSKRVKCVYIDPPYNIGEESWVFNDKVDSPEIRAWLGKVVGRKAEDLSRHDKWLCMMYPRLMILQELLSDDGSFWMSIDDNEVQHARMILDEVFGEKRFIACNVWQKRYSRENREAIGDVHEYILVYAMNPSQFTLERNRVPPTDEQLKVYKNPNNDPRGRWRPIPMTAQAGHATDEQFYEITAPGGKVHVPPEGRCWSLSEATFNERLKEGRIYFGKSGNAQPNVIRYLSEVDGFVPWTWWPHEEVGHTDESKKEIHALFGKKDAFDTPKPERLMRRILNIATNEGDLILDSFLGSGTTSAVAHKMNRRYIGIELGEHAREFCAPRLQKVIQGEQGGISENQNWKGGGGFRFCELGPTLFDSLGKIRLEVSFKELANHIFFTELGEPVPEGISNKTPLIGIAQGIGIYLLFNGVIEDESPDGGNVLTPSIFNILPEHEGVKVIYGNGCTLSRTFMQKHDITFRQIPYGVKAFD